MAGPGCTLKELKAGETTSIASRLEMPGTLYIVGMPIGNPEDISLRALRILRDASFVAVEDGRSGKALLARLGIVRDVVAYRRDTRLRIVALLMGGADGALIADVGTPLIADPGASLIRMAIAAGIRIASVPGAVAAIAALVSSGMGGGSFVFDGFPPRTPTERTAFFSRLTQETRTIVLYERRMGLRGTLRDLARALGPARPISISFNLTKPGETTLRTTLKQAILELTHIPMGEVALVIGASAMNTGESEERGGR